MKAAEVARAAREALTELTDHEVEAVSGLERNGEGWIVRLEALEVERVPKTMDVLATYEVTLDEGGDLVSFRRRRRYHRAATEEDD